MVTSRELIRLVDSPTSGGVAKKTLAPDSGVSRRRFVDACSVADEVVAKSRDTARRSACATDADDISATHPGGRLGWPRIGSGARILRRISDTSAPPRKAVSCAQFEWSSETAESLGPAHRHARRNGGVSIPVHASAHRCVVARQRGTAVTCFALLNVHHRLGLIPNAQNE
jgi:hypothetical protein